ncbi:MAG: response regulator [Planctomycetota bacterium]|jgi:PAS domain S-box-containing protein
MAETVKVPEALQDLFDRAEALVGAYFRRKREDPRKGHIEIDGERYILVRAASLSVEFYDMMAELYQGVEAEAFPVAKNLLFHIAHFIGRSDAREFHEKLDLRDPVAKLSAGPIHFAYSGWAFVDIFPESDVQPNEDYFLVYDHPYSFESDSWRKAGRKAPFPACFMNAGYSSGWCEESFGVPLVATEILCVAHGDPCCRFVMAHPSRIDEAVGRYLDKNPDVASRVKTYEVPGEFVRKELERRLRVSEDRYRLLFDHAFDAIVLLEGGKIRHVNRRTAELFGRPLAVLKGRSLADFSPETQTDGLPSREIFERRIVDAMGGEPQVFPFRCLGADGSPFDLDVSLNRVEGDPGSLMAILRDVTERMQAREEKERLEGEVRQLQKMEALGTLAGGVAHDFNNLLTGVLGSISVLRGELPRHHPVQQVAEDALGSVERASALVRHLLTFARTSPEVTHPVDINAVMAENLRLLRKAIDRRIAFDIRTGPQELIVEGDSNHLSQVIVNLTLNARDTILEKLMADAPFDGKPAITFETRPVRIPEWTSAGRPPSAEGDFVLLSVSDNGRGMDRETWERAFEPFFTTKPVGKGTGLGLTMVYGILQRHGGWVDIDTDKGEGTRVNVYLPRLAERSVTPPPREILAVEPAGKDTVLFVDDEPLLRNVAERHLRGLGYSVHTAGDGEAGVTTFQREADSIDVVVLDLTMPGLTGLQALAKIRTLSPSVPVIIASGYSGDVDAKEVLGAGADLFLPKPYAPEDLTRCIRKVLGRPDGGEGGRGE